MYKVILEETFFIPNEIRIKAKSGVGLFTINRGLYKRLIFVNGNILWAQFNDGKSDYGGHSNIEFIEHKKMHERLEQMYLENSTVKAEQRDKKIDEILDNG